MEADFRQLILLAIAWLVPLFLLRTKREQALLGWVCVTMFVQLFDTAIVTNLPAGRIVGLLCLPAALAQLHDWMRLKAVRAWMINLLYLVILGLAFGWIWPWPDITMARPFTLSAQGRLIVYTVRLLSDFSLALFIANQLRRPGVLLYLGRALVVGGTLTALAGLSYLATRTDVFFPITGLGEQAVYLDRTRGFSAEPRALGLSCAYSIMALLLGRARLFRFWPLLVGVNLLALLITYSTSSYVLLAAGVLAGSVFFTNRERAVVFGTILLAAAIVAGAVIYAPERVQQAADTLQLRLDPDYKLSGIPPGTIGQEIAYRLDVFDASALLFFLDQPLYALLGTGPGMIALPASYYVPPGIYSFIWTPEVGVNSPPSHGILLELSNSGLPGLILWFAQVIACWQALRLLGRRIARGAERTDWMFAYAFFIIGALFYLVQVSSSPLWSLFLGVGWMACRIVDERVRGVAPIRAVDWPAGQAAGLQG
jgi:O-Antigen ligase